ncbi:RNA methyltransferase [Babesia caballi]|uniref:RNA methyltransferase n=1 Tax=Babesia caballi TaxID=5871 RepID=A0AAV4LWB0_BABCB|nr:RNA methyltransferase [Babesia caballi]
MYIPYGPDANVTYVRWILAQEEFREEEVPAHGPGKTDKAQEHPGLERQGKADRRRAAVEDHAGVLGLRANIFKPTATYRDDLVLRVAREPPDRLHLCSRQYRQWPQAGDVLGACPPVSRLLAGPASDRLVKLIGNFDNILIVGFALC